MDTVQPMRLIFRNPQGGEETLDFEKGPSLGLKLQKAYLRNKVYINKVHPGGAAAELGAKVGWVLKSIDGESVAQLGGNKAIAVLSEKAKNLPDRDLPPPAVRAQMSSPEEAFTESGTMRDPAPPGAGVGFVDEPDAGDEPESPQSPNLFGSRGLEGEADIQRIRALEKAQRALKDKKGRLGQDSEDFANLGAASEEMAPRDAAPSAPPTATTQSQPKEAINALLNADQALRDGQALHWRPAGGFATREESIHQTKKEDAETLQEEGLPQDWGTEPNVGVDSPRAVARSAAGRGSTDINQRLRVGSEAGSSGVVGAPDRGIPPPTQTSSISKALTPAPIPDYDDGAADDQGMIPIVLEHPPEEESEPISKEAAVVGLAREQRDSDAPRPKARARPAAAANFQSKAKWKTQQYENKDPPGCGFFGNLAVC